MPSLADGPEGPTYQAECPFCERDVLVFEDPPRCPLCTCPIAPERLSLFVWPEAEYPSDA